MRNLTWWKAPLPIFGALIVGAALLTFSMTAHAHGSVKPKYGGVTQLVGEMLFELVVSPDGVALYLEDDGNAVPSADMTAKLVLTTDKGKTDVALTPAAGNKFEGKGVKIAAGSKVIVMIVNKVTQARTGANITLK